MTDAHTHTVSTSADAGDVPDLRKKTRPVLDQRGTLTRDQSEKEESSEDEEETDKKCFVGDSLPPISRQKSNRTTSNSEEAHTSLVSKHKLTSRPLVSGLAHITESSNQEPLRTLLHHSRSDDERSTRDSTSDRHRHVRSTRSCRNRPSRLQQQLGSLPNASLQSLFSSLTTSSGSSGSLTATQNSYDKLAVRRHRPSKRRSAKESGSRSHARRPVNPSARSGAQRTRRTMDMNFATEVRDESRDVRANMSRPASSASRASRKDSILSPPTPASRRASASSSTASASRGKSNVAWKRQETFNSDSGISVTSSPEESLARRSAHPSQKRYTDGPSDDDSSDEDDSPKGLVPTLRASSAAGMPLPSPMRALPDADPFVQRLQDQEAALKHHMLHSPQPKRSIRPQVNQLPSHHPSPALPLYDPRATSVPGLYPFHPPGQMLSANNHVHTHSDYDMEEYEPQSHGSRFQLDVNKKTVTGYEKLAEKLSQVDSSANQSQSFKPLYRQFKQLNHRILLHLQDEITELEEELRALDEAIAQTTGFSLPEASPIPPASRRAEARYGSELHYQRTQILGKVFMKMQQYSKQSDLDHAWSKR